MPDSIDPQRKQWEQTYIDKPGMFGEQPSAAGQAAADLFEQEGVATVLELGGGHGRDTLFFARRGFDVTVLDYAAQGVVEIENRARNVGHEDSVIARAHDVRTPLPVAEATVDGCFSHMLFCMAMSTPELEALTREVWRVLRPGGWHVYTVRNTSDPHFGVGIHHGEDRYETGGYQVHFFNRQKVEQLVQGFELTAIDEFDEGVLPRRLFRVTLRKPANTAT